MIKLLWIVILIISGSFSYLEAQDFKVIINDTFTSDNGHWKEVKLNGANIGTFSLKNHLLSITNKSKSGSYGLYNLMPVKGNFYAEAEFTDDDVTGLALIAVKNGVPDISNYTMIAVTDKDGITFVNQYDKQNDIENVHDPKKIIDPLRYEAKLDSQTFSVPYRSTNKKIRILHESLSNTFHFYYGLV